MTKDLATTGITSALAVDSTSDDALENLKRQAESMNAAYELANAICGTSMVPKQFQGKPDAGAAAILYGAELGLNAIQSLQNIMVINGKPGIEARTMVALIKRRGFKVETIESGPESVTVRGTSPAGETESSTWDMDRAKKAGYTSNALYSKIPEQMLYAKAATEVCRKLAPDVLLGMPYSVEELRSQPFIDGEVVEPTRGPGKLDRAISAPKGGQGAAMKAQPKAEAQASKPVQAKRTPDSAKKAISQAKTIDRVNEIAMAAQAEFDPDTFAGIAKIADEQIANLEALAAGGQ